MEYVHVIGGENASIARVRRMDSIIDWTCWIWAFVIAVRVGWLKGIAGFSLFLFVAYGLWILIFIE